MTHAAARGGVNALGDARIAGRSRLGRPLGGGSAEVYCAQDERLGRTVVVKLARTGAVGFDAERFENETRLLASLRHPGLVTLYDGGTVDDLPRPVEVVASDGLSLRRALEQPAR